MQKITQIKTLRQLVADIGASGKKIAFVPTMGALHDGHLSLIKLAKQHGDHVMASIFVNPTQFNNKKDLARYPKTIPQDLKLLKDASVNSVFIPEISEIYPKGFSTNINVGHIGNIFEGASRPKHFDGVVTIVTKLLLLTNATSAIFGEKDYQQLCIIRKVVKELNIPCKIIGAPTIREPSGLAMSSRNRFLSKEELEIAPILYKILQNLKDIENAKKKLLDAGFNKIDYINIVDPVTLDILSKPKENSRIIAAVRLGDVRLIDNV